MAEEKLTDDLRDMARRAYKANGYIVFPDEPGLEKEWLDTLDDPDAIVVRGLGFRGIGMAICRPEQADRFVQELRKIINDLAQHLERSLAALERLQIDTGEEYDDPIQVVTMGHDGQSCTWNTFAGLSDELEQWWDSREDDLVFIRFHTMSEAAYENLPEHTGW